MTRKGREFPSTSWLEVRVSVVSARFVVCRALQENWRKKSSISRLKVKIGKFHSRLCSFPLAKLLWRDPKKAKEKTSVYEQIYFLELELEERSVDSRNLNLFAIRSRRFSGIDLNVQKNSYSFRIEG